MKAHDCKETKGTLLEDKTLIGYFTFIERLINMIINKYGNDKIMLSDVAVQT